MSAKIPGVRKITISLPTSLVEFADREAARLNISRSWLIADALAEIKAVEEQRLAAEGYGFYAQEASEFAEASVRAAAQRWRSPTAQAMVKIIRSERLRDNAQRRQHV